MSIEPPKTICGGLSATSGPTPESSAEPEDAAEPAQTSRIRSIISSKALPREPKSTPAAS